MPEQAKTGSPVAIITNTLDEYLVGKAPALPENWKVSIVKFLPWITLILLIIALPAVLVLFGIGTVLAPFAYLGGMGAGTTYTLTLIVLALSLVLEAVAIPGLFKRSRSAWNLLYYSVLVSFIYNLLNLNILGAVVWTLVYLYFLFQIRKHYT